MGINTIKELATYDKNIIVEKFKSHGKLIWEFANGIDESDVYDKKREQKSKKNCKNHSAFRTCAYPSLCFIRHLFCPKKSEKNGAENGRIL